MKLIALAQNGYPINEATLQLQTPIYFPRFANIPVPQMPQAPVPQVMPTIQPQPPQQSGIMPNDWIQAIDPNTGSTYFYNKLTGQTSYVNPMTVVPQQQPIMPMGGVNQPIITIPSSQPQPQPQPMIQPTATPPLVQQPPAEVQPQQPILQPNITPPPTPPVVQPPELSPPIESVPLTSSQTQAAEKSFDELFANVIPLSPATTESLKQPLPTEDVLPPTPPSQPPVVSNEIITPPPTVEQPLQPPSQDNQNVLLPEQPTLAPILPQPMIDPTTSQPIPPQPMIDPITGQPVIMPPIIPNMIIPPPASSSSSTPPQQSTPPLQPPPAVYPYIYPQQPMINSNVSVPLPPSPAIITPLPQPSSSPLNLPPSPSLPLSLSSSSSTSIPIQQIQQQQRQSPRTATAKERKTNKKSKKNKKEIKIDENDTEFKEYMWNNYCALLMLECNPSDEETITIVEAAKLMKKSGLDGKVIKEIYLMADKKQKKIVDRKHFTFIIQAIALALNDIEITKANIKQHIMKLPYPKFTGLESVLKEAIKLTKDQIIEERKGKDESSSSSSEEEEDDKQKTPITPSTPQLDESEIWSRYNKYLFNEADEDKVGFVSGNPAVKFLRKSKVPVEVLKILWQIVDNENTGRLYENQFKVFLQLISQYNTTGNFDLSLNNDHLSLPVFEGYENIVNDVKSIINITSKPKDEVDLITFDNIPVYIYLYIFIFIYIYIHIIYILIGK